MATPSPRNSRAEPRRHLGLVTDLAGPEGRTLAREIQHQCRLSDAWDFCSVFHHGETPVEALKHSRIDVLLVTAPDGLMPRGYAKAAPVAILISPFPHHRIWLPQIVAEPALAGSLTADAFIRRGYRDFVLCDPGDCAYRTRLVRSFQGELERAALPAARVERDCPSSEREADFFIEARGPGMTWLTPPVFGLSPSLTARIALRLARSGSLPGAPASEVSGYALAPPMICSDPEDAFVDPVMAQVSRHIDESLREAVQIPAVVNKFGIPRRSLERRYRAACGNSLLQDILRRQILRARVLLANPETPLAEVAEAAGFRDTRQFSLCLKRLTGQTPRELRRNFSLLMSENIE